MNDITIPPEALEAAVKAMQTARNTGAHLQWPDYWDNLARAAILAMLNAWPGAIHNGHWLLFPHTKIPLPTEPSDDK
jgi:hypothetical protein